VIARLQGCKDVKRASAGRLRRRVDEDYGEDEIADFVEKTKPLVVN
jgi:hypothetical protein